MWSFQLKHFLSHFLFAAFLSLPALSFADSVADPISEFIASTETMLAQSEQTSPDTITYPHENVQSENDLWARIRQGYGIPDLESPLVITQLNWYGNRTAYIERTTKRASLYLYHVVEELEKRGMPTELALLPFVESAFNPHAISSAKAAGMWQFIPSTGRDFNLRQNIFQDERRDILDSTDAALTYLQKLYDMFGDWQLALAAYNWGEGSVQRAIKKQQAASLPIDFNSLSHLMPKETQNYVPKLQAVKSIVSNPGLFNITLPKLENQPYFVIIDKTRDIDVQVAAQLAELTVTEFKLLNPQFNRPLITGSADTKILLPTANAEIYQNNLDNWDGPLSSWSAYTVRKNERIENIARHVGAQASVLREVNQVPVNMLVKAGSTLLIPKTNQADDADIDQHILDNASLVLTRETPQKIIQKIRITATQKDSLASLAKRYKVTATQIKQWNNLASNSLKAGQKLQLEVAISATKRKGTQVARSVSKKSKSLITGNKRSKKMTMAQSRL